MKTKTIVLANFGGPRNINEIPIFLSSLLTDPLITGTFLPKKLHYSLFNFIAKKRAKKVSLQYEKIGGKSPIFTFTENLAQILHKLTKFPIITFHRYLPATHNKTLSLIHKAYSQGEIIIIPLFPHFSQSVTGSIATFLSQNLPKSILTKCFWIKSFGDHQEFIDAMTILIKQFITKHHINSKKLGLIFSAHGIPKIYIKQGDSYYEECLKSFEKIKKQLFPIPCILAFQSKLGPLPWIKPYTKTICLKIPNIMPEKTYIGIVPFGFLSDHIETLYEIEEYYLPIINSFNKKAFRCPALNLEPYWISRLIKIISTSDLYFANNLI